MCTDGGILLFTIFDNRCAASLLIMTLLEVLAIAWIYGADNFIDHAVEMGMKAGMQRRHGILRWFWKIMWMVITPIVLLIITILSWINREPLKYEDYEFPVTVERFGWVIELGPLIFVFIMPLYDIVQWKLTGHNRSFIYSELFKLQKKSDNMKSDDEKPNEVSDSV